MDDEAASRPLAWRASAASTAEQRPAAARAAVLGLRGTAALRAGGGDNPRRPRSRRWGWAAAASLVAASVAPATVAASSPSGTSAAAPGRQAAEQVTPLAVVAGSLRVPRGLQRLGMLAATTPMRISLALEPRDAGGLARYAAAVADPASPEYRHFLTPSQVGADFGPSRPTIAQAVAALRAGGLEVGRVPANGMLVSASGPAGAVEATFHTALAHLRLGGGVLGFAPTSAPLLPRPVAGSVAAVIGLEQLAPARALAPRPALQVAAAAGAAPRGPGAPAAGLATPAARARLATLAGATTAKPATGSNLPRACAAAVQTALFYGGWTEVSIANAYGFAPLLTRGDVGAGQTIALYEQDPFAMSDIASFEKCYFGRSRTSQIHVVKLDGYRFSGPGQGEALLDIEEVAALAPAAKIVVYEAPDNNWANIDEDNAIVSQDRANIVSISYGSCETQLENGTPGQIQVENTLFEEAAAEGMTVVAASGDTGADTCASSIFGHGASPAAPVLSVSDPASQPYVLGVGGASLQADTTPPQQTAWNDGATGGASGGGRSNAWASPTWQSSSGVAGTTGGKRQVPDVSGVADEIRGVTVFSKEYAPVTKSGVRVFVHPPGILGAGGSSRTATAPPGAAGKLAGIAGALAGSAGLGSRSLTGASGTTGASGAVAVGPTGASGPSGLSGASGASGATGASGAPPTTSTKAPVPAGWTVSGGTSAAAPQWAAALALVADAPQCAKLPSRAGGRDLGFVPPQLYAIASNPSAYAASFSQIRTGNNDIYGIAKGYSAGPGYNMVTGLGSPLLAGPSGQAGLAANLCALATGSALHGPAVPAVRSVTPAAGAGAGGTSVTIAGSGFPARADSSLHVLFGTVEAKVTSVGAGSITVVVPPAAVLPHTAATASAGAVDVTVTERSGGEQVTSSPSPGARYSYLTPPSPATPTAVPEVAAVSPPGGLPAGGNAVDVHGSGFSVGGGVTSVTFGGVPARYTVLSDSLLRAVPPPLGTTTGCSTGPGFAPAALCQVSVVVASATGSSTSSRILPGVSGAIAYDANGLVIGTPETETTQAPTEYDYAAKPVITSVSPDPANAAGTTPVAIHGKNLSYLTVQWVDIGPSRSIASQALVPISYQTSSEIVFDPPASPGGTTPGPAPFEVAGGVSVQGISGASNAKPFAYAGTPTVTGISKLGGPQTGGTVLAVRGVGLSDTAFVGVVSALAPASYGYATANVLKVVSDREILVRLPAYVPGPVVVIPCSETACGHVDVRTDLFVYYDIGHPQLLGQQVKSGPASGGTQVLLYGFDLDSATAVLFGSNPATLLRLPYTTSYPDGDPFLLGVKSAPGVPGSRVKITVVTPSGTVSTATPAFGYTASAPSPPAKPVVRAAASGVTVSWQTPLSDGGSALGPYHLTATPSTGPVVSVTVPATTHSVTFTNLHALTTYQFTLAASNAAHGTGPSVVAASVQVPYRNDGFRVLTAAGAVLGAGSLSSLGGIAGQGGAPAVGIASTHDANGYWIAQSDGTVTGFGTAPTLRSSQPASPVVAIVSTRTGAGYWLLEANGTVLGTGNATAYGHPAHQPASDPAVAIVADAGDRGYAVLTRNGTVTGYGTAAGVHGKLELAAGVHAVGLAALSSGVAVLESNGKVAGLHGAAAQILPATQSPVAILATPDGHGYWVLAASGKAAAHGDARALRAPALPATSGAAIAIAAD